MRPLAPFAILLALAAMSGAPSDAPDAWVRDWPRTDFATRAVDLADIIPGGPGRDGIPAIDRPRFVGIAAAGLAPNDPVIGLVIDGTARAYPLAIMIWHEIVNDTLGDTPVAVTYCPLCNAAIVFDRRVAGRVLDFGVTGMLRNSDLVMYDRQSESWWQQFTGEAIVGAMTGARLKIAPARLESFAQFSARAPDGLVLAPPNGPKPYGQTPYAGYDSAAQPFLYDGAPPRGIAPLARVVTVEGEAWALDLLRAHGTLVTPSGVELTWRAGQASALDTPLIARGRDVGTVIARRRTDGGWADVAYGVDFAFAFHAFHPDAPIHTRWPDGGQPEN